MTERFRTSTRHLKRRWIGVAALVAVAVMSGLAWRESQDRAAITRQDLLFQVGSSDPARVVTALERLMDEFGEPAEGLFDRLEVGGAERMEILRTLDRAHLRPRRAFGYAFYLLGDVAGRDEGLRASALALRDSIRVAFIEAADLVPPSEAQDNALNRRVRIEGGTFEMGSDSATGQSFGMGFAGKESPVRRVTMDAFHIQEHEVTNEEYRRFNPVQRCPGRDRQPAICVTWYDAMAYAAWLGGALPTEAQWEATARGKEGRKYPWGNDEPSCDLAYYNACVPPPPARGGVRGLADNVKAWATRRFGLANPSKTNAVMSRPAGATPEGVHDLANNAWEWVSNWYGVYLPTDTLNPRGPESGSYRQLRGGSILNGVLRGSYRIGYDQRTNYGTSGFRVAWPGTQD